MSTPSRCSPSCSWSMTCRPSQPGGVARRPWVYTDTLIVKALLVMIVRQLPAVGSLLAVVAEPTA